MQVMYNSGGIMVQVAQVQPLGHSDSRNQNTDFVHVLSRHAAASRSCPGQCPRTCVALACTVTDSTARIQARAQIMYGPCLSRPGATVRI
jgi:hypothetical protein